MTQVPKLAWSGMADALPVDRRTADPLGFRTAANAVARVLVPGLTQSTNHVRGFSLLTLGLQIATAPGGYDGDTPDDRYLRFERLWVLSQADTRGRGRPLPGVKGARRLLDVTWPKQRGRRDPGSGTGWLSLTVPLLQAPELSSSGWGMYRGGAEDFGLIQSSNGGRARPGGRACTSLGNELAQTVRKAVFQGLHIGQDVKQSAVGFATVALIGERGSPGAALEEVQVLGRAVRQFDVMHDAALQRLARAHAAGRLFPRRLKPQELTSAQKEALEAAKALLHLMSRIEAGFRTWMAADADAVDVPTLSAAAWELATGPTWDRYGDLARLRAKLGKRTSARSFWGAVQDHHDDLAARRRSAQWRKDAATAKELRYRAPDFTFGSARALFEEGLLKDA